MPTVAELTALYGNFMLGPRRGPEVCDVCFNFTSGYPRCFACDHGELWLDAFCPVSYSVGREQLHHALRRYKRPGGRRITIELAAVLWRHLARHEQCLAAAVADDGFELVTTVPSSDAARDEHHPLHVIAGELVAPIRARHRRLLRRSAKSVDHRMFDAEKYEVTERLDGRSVLLIDDTWTTGANAQSAAAALKAAGAGSVGAIVIGRFLNRGWHENDRRLRGISQPFDWERCALCDDGATPERLGAVERETELR